MNIAPCKGCSERYIGCHSECEKYREFRAKQDEAIKAKAKFLGGLYTSQNAKKTAEEKAIGGQKVNVREEEIISRLRS